LVIHGRDDMPEVPDTVVVTRVSTFGSGGARSSWTGPDIVGCAAGGYRSMNGDLDREPVKPYGHAVTYQAGLHAALGTLVGLAARDRDGAGQVVDVATAEAAAFLVGGALQRSQIPGREIRRNGARVVGFGPGYHYPSTIRPCAGGFVHAHSHNRFPELLGALLQEPRLTEPDLVAERMGHADEIDAALDAWLAARDKWSAAAEAQELRVPFTEVLDPAEVVEDRLGHLGARGFFVDVEHPVVGTVTQPGAPVIMPATPWRTARAPLLGEHNVDVYCGELGLPRRDLARLAAAGVV
jgi:crotonobetainyl-CoA:carnitine CoA-transferase CaiB-like acyl-CoA transferase